MKFTKYPITPVSKPRQTRAGSQNPKNPVMQKFYAFRDECRLRKVTVPLAGAHVVFVMPMPPPWSDLKQQTMNGKPHEQVPDVDNLCKALLDSAFEDDRKVSDIRITKIWGYDGMIAIGESDESQW